MSLAACAMFIAIISLPAPSGSVGRLAVVQIGREGREPGVAEAVGDVDDVRHEAPPLLDHDHARAAAVGEVAVAGAAVAREADHLTHGAHGRTDRSSACFVRSQCATLFGAELYRITLRCHDRDLDRSLRGAYPDDRAHVFHSWSAQAALDPGRRRRRRGLAVLGRRAATATSTSPASSSTSTSATSTRSSSRRSRSRPTSCARSRRSTPTTPAARRPG